MVATAGQNIKNWPKNMIFERRVPVRSYDRLRYGNFELVCRHTRRPRRWWKKPPGWID